MPESRLLRAATLAAASLLLALPGSALGAQRFSNAPWATDGFRDRADAGLVERSAFNSAGIIDTGQHGPSSQHLPAVRENIELVGKLEMDTPDQFKFDPVTGAPDPTEPDVNEGQIADLAVYKNAAYMMSWSEASCARGGFFSVDISNPAQPRQLAFRPARTETYHGEGAHVITATVGGVSRDILGVNNEACGTDGTGGFELYDVTNPANPIRLTEIEAGDRSAGQGTDVDPGILVSSYHSIFLWQDGEKVYAVTTDNDEQGSYDVDIFDITNPTVPVHIGDHNLKELAAAQGVNIRDNEAHGNQINNHDMVVKKIGNVQTLLVSYWDAGYVKVDVNDPAQPKIIGDSAYPDVDPESPLKEAPEGNGHQAEFSHDNRYVLAADEDFSTYRTEFNIVDGPERRRVRLRGVRLQRADQDAAGRHAQRSDGVRRLRL